MSMFCYQCEQTSQATGCTTIGVCGKSPDTAALQDLIVYATKGISQYTHRLRQLGVSNNEINDKILEALFMTLTNVNFDCEEHFEYVLELAEVMEKAKTLYLDRCKVAELEPETLHGPVDWKPNYNQVAVMAFAHSLSIYDRINENDPTIVGLEELVTYGLKGLAAYAHHARLLGFVDEKIMAFLQETLNYLAQPTNTHTKDELLSYAMRVGECNVEVMALLDKAHTETFGHPEPTMARTTPVKGKAILVSGHDLKALYELLKQTEGKGINVYTHGELLPALAYPTMKRFPHLVGNYGTAWQNQVKEFSEFPGAILMTTNCLKPPTADYIERLFSTDVVGFSGMTKLPEYQYGPLIEKALELPGFPATEELRGITIGFARNSVLSVADKVIEAVKSKKINHFFLIGGCDGAEYSRNYYTDLAEAIPADSVILTLGCGKYRFNMSEFGDIEGIPRLLDLGQCNDAYSAVKIASALAEALEMDINDLPLSLVLSWFEQKAVAVLLSLLYLGIRDIRIGPTLPAFITQDVLNLLVEGFALKPITRPEKDLATMLS